MKILYDHQAFSMQDFGGVSKIFFELSSYLRHYPDVITAYPRMFSNNDYIHKDLIISAWSFFKNDTFKGRGTILAYLKTLNKAFSKSAIQKGEFDIFHPTYYDPYYSNYNINKPIVVTCYDLIHEKYKQSDLTTLAWKKKSLGLASKIIAISENTKTDLMEYYNIPSERIGVVHLGSSFEKIDASTQTKYQDIPYFLYVGNRDSYKNFDFFVKSITPLLGDNKDIHLYCAGGPSFSKSELLLFNELKIGHKVKYFNGSNETLRTLYSQATALIYPSLYEGFGIPLLEAMSCRCPVVSSNKSSLPEVAGDAAIYFDPFDQESISHAVKLILDDESLRESLKIKGIQRVANFSWEKSARQTFEIYKSIL